MHRPASRAALLGLLLLASTGATGCDRSKDAPPAPPPPKVGVTKPVTVPVQGFFEYNGTLESTKSVEIRARVRGFLTGVHFAEGTEVRGPDPKAGDSDMQRGEKLYSIDQREYKTNVRKAEAELAKADADVNNWKAQIKLATAELDRLSQAGSATSRTELEKAKATLEVNQAEMKAAEAAREAADAALHSANIQFGYTDIRAPFSGLISRTMVYEGNLVGQTDATLLTTVVKMDELYVLFDAPERDLVDYQRALAGQKSPDPAGGATPVTIGVTGETGYPHTGTIDFRENRVDSGTGTIRIRGRVPNPKVPPNNVRLLYPGLYARVRVQSGPAAARPVVPEEALGTGQEGRFVYVVGADNAVTKRTVTVGTQVYRAPPPGEGSPPPAWAFRNPKADGPPGPVIRSIVSIEKGLKADDVIVVDGLQRVRPGTPVAPEMFDLVGPVAGK